ncbi:hypothetical protein PROFUN_17047, partial [Planoprotostelium fungivorum]
FVIVQLLKSFIHPNCPVQCTKHDSSKHQQKHYTQGPLAMPLSDKATII